ncbi:MAG TPA: hypothetical protein VHW45_11295 [Candidatus Sulfotelmatobacter sp.]|jgi:hypothetical protein|nr:hypothetical protein [Candidatus Sulfotelmatobacter sp.]
MSMLQAHSFLWHYLWLAPGLLSLFFAVVLWLRGEHRKYPFFVVYLLFVPVEQFCLYIFDLSPRISAVAWWYAFWVGTIVEGMLKFAILSELLRHLLSPWPSIAKLVRNVVSGSGVFLVFLAAVVAAFAAPDNVYRVVASAHILSHTLYLIEAGLIISIFLAAALFRIPWERITFGISLGFAVTWCEHSAIWALVTEGIVRNRGWEDFVNMATYHLSVLIWYYYLLAPTKQKVLAIPARGQRPAIEPAGTIAAFSTRPGEEPKETLHDWNRILERLIHQ